MIVRGIVRKGRQLVPPALWSGVVAGALLLAAPVQAQQATGFGGSFDTPQAGPDGAAVAQPVESGEVPPGGSGDGFGGGSASGSDGFGGGSFVAEGGGGGGTETEAGTGGIAGGNAGSDGFGGGSFDMDGAGGGGGGAAPGPGGGGGGDASAEGFGGGSFDTGGGGAGGTGGGDAGGGGSNEWGAGGGGAEPPSQLVAFELQDFGVPPTQTLHHGAPHGATPAQIPGGKVITTEQLVALTQSQRIVLIDVLGGNMTLPGALTAAGLGMPGNFNDQIQSVLVQGLQQVTNGNPQTPIVFFCLSPHCWLSYNAALRAIAAGYSNVFWYRGGIEAWAMAGLELVPARGG